MPNPLEGAELVRTGIPGLDTVLLGGAPRNNNILVEGGPGAGKTTMGLRFIHAGASEFGEPGIIISFELDPRKLLRDALGFDWDLAGAIEAGTVKIVETSPAVLLAELTDADGVLATELRAMGARRLLIDGLTPMRLRAMGGDVPFRERLHRFIDGLTRMGVTSFVTREAEADGGEAHERYVFDTIINLGQRRIRGRIQRTLTVVKSRGQDFIAGVHTMRIVSGEGVRVYPRAESRPKRTIDQPTSTVRVSTGCETLDELMDGGLFEGSVTMVSGISGSGKTVAGVQFLTEGAARGHKCLLVSLDEHPQQLIRNATTLGLPLAEFIEQGKVHVFFESPLELELDVHFDRITQLVEAHDIDLVVCDSVAVYETNSGERASDFLYALATYFKNRLATVYFNYESPELLGVSQISKDLRASHLVDNILLLSYVEISTRLRRALAVPKARGSQNIQTTREFEIREGGIALVEEAVDTHETKVPQLPFSHYDGLLSRSPSRRAPAVDQALANGDELPGDTPMKEKKPNS